MALTVASQDNLAVSLFTARPTGPPTADFIAHQTNYISTPGDFSADHGAGVFTTEADAWYFLAAVDVLVYRRVRGTIVALGDSITDGSESTPNANRRWPDVLARELLVGPNAKAVANAGIVGNNVHESSVCFGDNAVARLGPDVFARSGVTDVIMLEGINDIIQPDVPEPERFFCLTTIPISAEGLIEHYAVDHRARARARFEDLWRHFDARDRLADIHAGDGEKRQQVNRWIRTRAAHSTPS